MAASIGNALPVLALGGTDDLVGIHETQNGKNVIVTYKKRYVSVIKVADQKPVHTRVLKNVQSFHCPVVEDGQSGKLVAVVDSGNKQELHTWQPGNDLEAEQFVVHRKISKLISVAAQVPIVVYEDGAFGLYSGLASASVGAGISNNPRVDWRSCAVTSGQYSLACGLVSNLVVCVAKVNTGGGRGNGAAAGSIPTPSRFACLAYPSELPKLVACCLLQPDARDPAILDRTACPSSLSPSSVLATLVSLDEAGDVRAVPLLQATGQLHFEETVGEALQQATGVKAEYLFSTRQPSSEAAAAPQASGLVALDATHVAVAVAESDHSIAGQGVLSIWDVKYCVMCSSVVLPACEGHCQLWGGQSHVYTIHSGYLQGYPYEATPSTILGLLGKSSGPQPASEHRSVMCTSWNKETGTGDIAYMQDAECKLLQLVEVAQTGTKKSFADAFEKLKRLYKDGTDDVRAMCSATASLVIGRLAARRRASGGKGSFWPHEELHFLVDNFSLPSSTTEDLVGSCLSEKDVRLLCSVLSSMRADVPEPCLVRIAKFALSENESIFKKFAKSELLPSLPSCDVQSPAQVEAADEPMDDGNGDCSSACPLSIGRTALINEIMKCPCNDVLMVEHLRALTFNEAISLLNYMLYMLRRLSLPATARGVATSLPAGLPLSSSTLYGLPNVGQVADWLGYLLDSHYAQLLLSSSKAPAADDSGADEDARLSCRDSLYALHDITVELVHFYDELSGLESLLSQLKNKHALPQKHVKGLYSIEVLHIY